ncbi:MAG: hypothetical protein ACE5JU_20390 [Candidatus Binatia bacterium]
MSNFARALIKQIIKIPPHALATFKKTIIHPFEFFRSNALEWDFKYFGACLAVLAFLFSYTIPAQEYSENWLMKWIIQIPVNKVTGLLSRGVIIFLSIYWMVPVFLRVIPFSFFSGFRKFTPHIKVFIYSFGTVYLTVSFILIGEHMVTIPFGQLSTLEAWKDTMIESKELEKKLLKRGSYIGGKQNEGPEEKFWQKSQRYARFGAEAQSAFWAKLSNFQGSLLIFMVVYGYVYPLFCLAIIHFDRAERGTSIIV